MMRMATMDNLVLPLVCDPLVVPEVPLLETPTYQPIVEGA